MDEPESASEERRRFPRLRESCQIKVRHLGGAQPPVERMDAMTVNISGGGLCYSSDTAASPGDFVAVELTVPEFPSPVVALARTAFSKPSEGMFEVGLEFWWVGWGDDTAQKAIANYIKTELRQD